MIKFEKHELDYIQKELTALMTSQDEACVIMREGLTKEGIKDIQRFIDSVDKVNIDEEENKFFIHVVYEHLGMWCFVDAEYTYAELLNLLKDKQFVDLFKKLYLDRKEVD